jgi:hypothetical protein
MFMTIKVMTIKAENLWSKNDFMTLLVETIIRHKNMYNKKRRDHT